MQRLYPLNGSKCYVRLGEFLHKRYGVLHDLDISVAIEKLLETRK